MTSNQSLLVILVTIVGLIVLIAINKLDAAVGIPVISGLAGVALPTPLRTPTATTQVTEVTRNPAA